MKLTLPPGLTPREFDAALNAFATVVGKEWVLATDEDRSTYVDVYAFGNAEQHAPSAAIAPASVEEVQAIVRVANERKIPLWPISRGKNYGYGGAAPRMPGTVVLDLGRMRKILEVDVKRAYCVVEPGVSFFDLHEYLTKNDIPLWSSMPGNSIGSVIGNALEHGLGSLPTGDRAANVCGMEVVLPSGELVRTGMGAMSDSKCWQLFKYGYGPSLDQLFMQSNFGIVTKMGCWLMPEPQSTLDLSMEVPNAEDIAWVVEALAPLRMQGVLPSPINIGNFLRVAMVATQRSDWYQGEGAMPEELLPQIMQKLGIGWWGVGITLYGHPEANEVNAKLVKQAFAKHTDQEFKVRHWQRGEPRPVAPSHGVPISFPLRVSNWAGPNGGHLGFSPIIPADRNVILEQVRRSRRLFREHGFDYYGGFTIGERYVITVNMLAYDRHDADMTRRAHELFMALMKDAEERNFGEYRSHVAYMDQVAETYDFNNHALRRLNETLKDALDPNGILAPGKQGIWPRRYRGERA